jgi:hypothetical protein
MLRVVDDLVATAEVRGTMVGRTLKAFADRRNARRRAIMLMLDFMVLYGVLLYCRSWNVGTVCIVTVATYAR